MNKTVLITGASNGIGKACALFFAMKGYNVAINYNSSEDEAKRLVSDINQNGKTAKAYKADISKLNQVEKMVAKVLNDFSKIDVLINNAGISLHGMFTDIDEEQWRNICGVNLDGAIFCSKQVIPNMLKHKNGRIINISSVWGRFGSACEVHYSVTKAGIIGLTKALSKEYAGAGITVNCIAPGVIDTRMLDVFDSNEKQALIDRTPCKRLGNAADVANAALFLADAKSDFITGQVIGVDGGFM